jgi:hypothetical protein
MLSAQLVLVMFVMFVVLVYRAEFFLIVVLKKNVDCSWSLITEIGGWVGLYQRIIIMAQARNSRVLEKFLRQEVMRQVV